MSKNRLNQGHAVPDLVTRFGVALDYFSLKVRETANIKHNASKGTERELNIQGFLSDLLPETYAARKGEAVDLLGTKSPQMDVMIYDRQKNFAFYTGDIIVLPAEALLASIEVKSRLNVVEVRSSQIAAGRLKSLKPMKKGLATTSSREPGAYRFLHCLFAYETDLAEKDWARHELDRIENCVEIDKTNKIDIVYVLKRGLINVESRKFIPEDEETGQALVAFHYSIYNFVDRENRRRPRAPYFNYATDLNRHWRRI